MLSNMSRGAEYSVVLYLLLGLLIVVALIVAAVYIAQTQSGSLLDFLTKVDQLVVKQN